MLEIKHFIAYNSEISISIFACIPLATGPTETMSVQLFVLQESNSELKELQYFVIGSGMTAHCSS